VRRPPKIPSRAEIQEILEAMESTDLDEPVRRRIVAIAETMDAVYAELERADTTVERVRGIVRAVRRRRASRAPDPEDVA
jgi:hypothetical protein